MGNPGPPGPPGIAGPKGTSKILFNLSTELTGEWSSLVTLPFDGEVDTLTTCLVSTQVTSPVVFELLNTTQDDKVLDSWTTDVIGLQTLKFRVKLCRNYEQFWTSSLYDIYI